MTRRKDKKGRVLRENESERADGRYQYRATIDGKRKTIYGATLEELRKKEKELTQQVDRGIGIDGNKMTVNELVTQYMESRTDWRVTTRAFYARIYALYIKDSSLGNKKVKQVRYSDVMNYFRSLVDDNHLEKLDVIRWLLSPAFTLAVKDEFIVKNPLDGISKDLKKLVSLPEKKRALTLEEQEAFVNWIRGENRCRYPNLYTFLLGTGCRIGEALGLQWEDCDFENGEISISRTLSVICEKGGKLKFCITSPKTSSGVRTIPMLSEVKTALLKEKEKSMRKGFCTGEVDGYTNFVFVDDKKRTPLYTAPVQYDLLKIIAQYNVHETELAKKQRREPVLLPRFSAHILRHTFCTRFCENEPNLKVIQEIMGHADIKITMNVYADATEKQKRATMKSLEGKMKIS